MGLILQSIPAYAVTAPELPRVYVDTSMPTTSITKTVCSSGCNYTNDQLQQAIDDAQLGTTILLQPGMTYTPLDDRGFILKNKTSGTGWIIIRPSAPNTSLPASGTRMTSSYMSVLPKIIISTVGNYAMSCEASAHHYRVIGLEFMVPTDVARSGAFVMCSSALETTLASQSHHIIFDRVYVHGPSAGGSYGVKYGIILGGQHQGVIDSTLEDLVSSDGEAKAVGNWFGAGPLVIRNNFLSSSGENIMIGGATPVISNLVPSDIEIRQNHFYKPLKWRDDPAYTSGPNRVLTKNLLEFKNAQRILIDGNVFENIWPDGQMGYAVVFTPKTGSVGSNDHWSTVADVTFTNNMLKNCADGLVISGGGPYILEGATVPGGRFLIANNAFIGLGGDYASNATSGNLAQISNGPFDVQFKHNTAVSYAGSTIRGANLLFTYGIADERALLPLSNFVVQDNIFHAVNYPLSLSAGGTNLGTVAPGYTWTNTVVAGPWPTPIGYGVTYPLPMPQGNGNAYPQGDASIGYVSLGQGNYHLATTSSYKNAASDGKDIGIDWDAFDAAQDPANNTPPTASTMTTTSTSRTNVTLTLTPTTTSPTPTTTTSTDTTTSTTSTTTNTTGRFLGKLKQLMDKVR